MPRPNSLNFYYFQYLDECKRIHTGMIGHENDIMHRVYRESICDAMQKKVPGVARGYTAIMNDPKFSRAQRNGARLLRDGLADINQLLTEFQEDKETKRRTFPSKVRPEDLEAAKQNHRNRPAASQQTPSRADARPSQNDSATAHYQPSPHNAAAATMNFHGATQEAAWQGFPYGNQRPGGGAFINQLQSPGSQYINQLQSPGSQYISPSQYRWTQYSSPNHFVGASQCPTNSWGWQGPGPNDSTQAHSPPVHGHETESGHGTGNRFQNGESHNRYGNGYEYFHG
jgi:hypothetical protein